MGYKDMLKEEEDWVKSHVTDKDEFEWYKKILASDISILRVYVSLYGSEAIKPRPSHNYYCKSPLLGMNSNEGYKLRLYDDNKAFFCSKTGCRGTIVSFIQHALRLSQADAINVLYSYVSKSTDNLSEKGIMIYNKIFGNYDSKEIKDLIEKSEVKEKNLETKIENHLKRQGTSKVVMEKAARKFCCSIKRVEKVALRLGKMIISEESKMQICYLDQKVLTGKKSIFLAGPTSREEGKISWRKYACEKLEKMGFDGIVYVPEYSTHEAKEDCIIQEEWVKEALSNTSVVLLWVPRKTPETIDKILDCDIYPGKIIYAKSKREESMNLKNLLVEATVTAEEVGEVSEIQILPIKYKKLIQNGNINE